MSDSPAPDPLAAYLAEVRKRAARLLPLNRKPSLLAEEVAQDVPRLLAGYDALLALHAKTDKPAVMRYLCSRHAAMGFPGRPASRAQMDACPDCKTTERYVCSHCRHECPDDDEWPCEDYQAISAALLSKETGDAV